MEYQVRTACLSARQECSVVYHDSEHVARAASVAARAAVRALVRVGRVPCDAAAARRSRTASLLLVGGAVGALVVVVVGVVLRDVTHAGVLVHLGVLVHARTCAAVARLRLRVRSRARYV